jgi:uncharacterized protein (DUF4415 family)
MAKKSRASSRRGRQAAKKKGSTWVRTSLEEAKARLLRQGDLLAHESEDSEIDFSDIPELKDSELKRMRRIGRGRPPLGDAPRKMISIKLDRHLLEELRSEAQRSGKPYQSLIHEILEKHFKRKAA